jgi:hypothetical protein
MVEQVQQEEGRRRWRCRRLKRWQRWKPWCCTVSQISDCTIELAVTKEDIKVEVVVEI